MNNLQLEIEAVIFASDQSISIEEIQQILASYTESTIEYDIVQEAINTIEKKYADNSMPVELTKLNKGYQFLTKNKFHSVINQLQAHRAKKKLSQAALETLAIIAYRQPITKLEIEQIRGVNCDYTIQKLLEKELISISGKADSVGKPLLYSSSPLFMDYFGINSIAELPQLKDIDKPENEIGDISE
ncbi:SMC-Scp complex subunit ScpB [Pedobacter sp. HMF7647]|uniref:SMC-Scp complex subunit ScpB n=1 Tax=Hufsiella arboris TaxID=2695275 RepID=A0A7K1Y849_9SPHI|nr:SMC-Scp complex subunit ScpB [Hufsiella arboris]MXV50228.1 SMC-Scp complex subunit ScpB [Hufsiella arboris]